jgi:hypothetical protein
VQNDARLVEWMPDALSRFVLAVIPAAVTFVSGWVTKHSPRSGTQAGA